MSLFSRSGLTDFADSHTASMEASSEQYKDSFVGKLKLHCPSLYFSLSAWERDHLDSSCMSGDKYSGSLL
jgi:hypothetical protein